MNKSPKERGLAREKAVKLLAPGPEGNVSVGTAIIVNDFLEYPKYFERRLHKKLEKYSDADVIFAKTV